MRQVIAASLIVFFEGLVLWTVIPIMPFFVHELGGTDVWVGICFMLMSAPRLISNPYLGRLSDRFGRRPLVIVSSLGAIAASIGWAIAPSVGWLAVSRGIAGAFATQATLCSAIVADVTTPQKRGSAMAILGAGFALSMVIGPLGGGLITHYISHAAVGWFAACTQVLTLLTAIFVLRDITKSKPEGEVAPRTHLRFAKILAFAGVPALLIVTFCLTLAQSQVTTMFPRLIQVVYSLTEDDAGYFISFLGLVGVLAQGGAIRSLLPRFGEFKVAIGGFALVAIGTAIVATLPAEWVLWVALGMIGAGSALSTPTITTIISRCGDENSQGALMGANQAATSLGRSCGSMAAGVLFGHVAIRSPFVLAVTVATLAVGLLIISRRKTAR